MRRLHVTTLLGILVPAVALSQEAWTPLDAGTTASLRAVHFVDVDTGYVVGAGGLILTTEDAGATWHDAPTGTMVDLHDVCFVDGVGVVVGDGGMILRTTDAGATWSSVASGVVDGLRSVSLAGSGGVCGGTSQTILFTADAGATWTTSQTGFFGGGFFGAVMLSADIAFVGGQNSIFQPLAGASIDGGETWSFDAFYLDGNEGSISNIDFTDQSTGYAASRVWEGSGALSRTSDGGDTWSTTLVASALYGVDFPISDASQIGYAVGDAGAILKTTDAGTSWAALDGPVNATLRGVCFVNADNGYVVGEAGTVLKTTTGGEVPTTGIGDPTGADASVRPLCRAVPNPFGSYAVLRLDVRAGERATITVIDAAGRRVRSLTTDSPAFGLQRVVWDGRDDAGRALPPGVYLYRVVLGDRESVGRLVRVR